MGEEVVDIFLRQTRGMGMGVDIRGLAPLLQVYDMPTAIHFYCDVLGFEVGATSHPGEKFDWALLKFGSVELMLNTACYAEQLGSVGRPPIGTTLGQEVTSRRGSGGSRASRGLPG